MEGKRKRHRAKRTMTLQERLTTLALDARTKARRLAPGAEREQLLKRARQAEQATELNEFLSVGPPK
nr:hypothetical protein [Bradyrhizobium zhanjiangense]